MPIICTATTMLRPKVRATVVSRLWNLQCPMPIQSRGNTLIDPTGAQSDGLSVNGPCVTGHRRQTAVSTPVHGD